MEHWREGPPLTLWFLRLLLGVLLLAVVCAWLAPRMRVPTAPPRPYGESPQPPALALETADIARATGGVARGYPSGRAATAPPSGADLERAFVSGEDPYASTLWAYSLGRRAEAYPAARDLALARQPGWVGAPSPREMAVLIERLARLMPSSYGARDEAGNEIYRFYLAGDNLLARQMALGAPAALRAALAEAPRDCTLPPGLLPIVVYFPGSEADWRSTLGERTAGRIERAAGVATGFTIAFRPRAYEGDLAESDLASAMTLAHETGHVVARASGAVRPPCWVSEGIAESAALRLAPGYDAVCLRTAASIARKHRTAVGRAMWTREASGEPYVLYYAATRYVRATYGDERFWAFARDRSLADRRKWDRSVRAHFGVGLRELEGDVRQWLTSGAWRSSVMPEGH